MASHGRSQVEFRRSKRPARVAVGVTALLVLPMLLSGAITALAAAISPENDHLSLGIAAVAITLLFLALGSIGVDFLRTPWLRSKTLAAHILHAVFRIPVLVDYYRQQLQWTLLALSVALAIAVVSLLPTYWQLDSSRGTLIQATTFVCEEPLAIIECPEQFMADLDASSDVYPSLSHVSETLKTAQEQGLAAAIPTRSRPRVPIGSIDEYLLCVLHTRLLMTDASNKISSTSDRKSVATAAEQMLRARALLIAMGEYRIAAVAPAEAAETILGTLQRLRAGLHVLYAKNWNELEYHFNLMDSKAGDTNDPGALRTHSADEAITRAYRSCRILKDERRGSHRYAPALNNYADFVEWRLRYYAGQDPRFTRVSGAAQASLRDGESELESLCKELETAARTDPVYHYFMTLSQLYCLRAHSAAHRANHVTLATDPDRLPPEYGRLQEMLDNVNFNLRVALTLGMDGSHLARSPKAYGLKWVLKYKEGTFNNKAVDTLIRGTRDRCKALVTPSTSR